MYAMWHVHSVLCCSVLQCVAEYCSALQCVAVCCSALQFAAVWRTVLRRVAAVAWSFDHPLVCRSVLQCVAVCCSALQCVAVCCSVLQCVAVCCSVLHYVVSCLSCCSIAWWFDRSLSHSNNSVWELSHTLYTINNVRERLYTATLQHYYTTTLLKIRGLFCRISPLL